MREIEERGFICGAICLTACGAGCLACIADGVIFIADAFTGGGAMNIGTAMQFQA